jgi:hypothetical protein
MKAHLTTHIQLLRTATLEESVDSLKTIKLSTSQVTMLEIQIYRPKEKIYSPD